VKIKVKIIKKFQVKRKVKKIKKFKVKKLVNLDFKRKFKILEKTIYKNWIHCYPTTQITKSRATEEILQPKKPAIKTKVK
jgi:hypothetical protein